MATHSRVRTVWNSGQPVLHGEFAALDFGQFDSISASGGTYAPTDAPIIIGGLGLQVPANVILGTGGTTSLTVDSTCAFDYQAGFFGIVLTHANVMIGDDNTTTATVNSNLIINSGFVANANSSFAGSGVHLSFGTGTVLSLASGSSLVCSAGALFNASVTCGSTLAVTGATTMASTLDVTGAITSDGASFNGTGAVNINTSGGAFLSCPMTCSGTARVIKRVANLAGIGADSSAYGPVNFDVVYVGSMTADATFTINGGVDGDEIRFVNKSATHFLTISDPGTGIQVALKNTAGQSTTALMMRMGGSFVTISSGDA